jgi:aldose 1-epimerase
MRYNKQKIDTVNGEDIYCITFINDNNFKITFYTYGGYIHNVIIPYKNNPDKFEDVILGYGDFNKCMEGSGYFNSIIGRVCNRISNSEFTLNNNTYKLFNNIGDDHLHGGNEGFDKKIWSIYYLKKNDTELKCELGYMSKNLDQGYPGNLHCKVTYALNNNNEFMIKNSAVSDADTVVNITNHNYWNFHGHGDHYKNITDHTVKIFSSHVCENNEQSIPTGKISHVRNTQFDFIDEKIITQNFLDKGGVDNNYDFPSNKQLKEVAMAYSNITRMGVTYLSDQPGNQFYTGNMMDDNYNGKYNKKYGLQYGFCFEPQLPPNGINEEKFQSPILKTNEEYNSTIIMKLSNSF